MMAEIKWYHEPRCLVNLGFIPGNLGFFFPKTTSNLQSIAQKRWLLVVLLFFGQLNISNKNGIFKQKRRFQEKTGNNCFCLKILALFPEFPNPKLPRPKSIQTLHGIVLYVREGNITNIVTSVGQSVPIRTIIFDGLWDQKHVCQEWSKRRK
jgi:hypothetical protein